MSTTHRPIKKDGDLISRGEARQFAADRANAVLGVLRAEHAAARRGLTVAYATAINEMRDDFTKPHAALVARVELLEARTLSGRWRRLVAWWRGFVQRVEHLADPFEIEWVDVDEFETPQQILPVPQEDLPKVAALRLALLTAGQRGSAVLALPSDLARFGLSRWDGMLLGVVCIDSPIISPNEKVES